MNRRYTVRRLLQVVPTVAGILVVTFVVVHATPGDPARDFAGEGATQQQIDAARSYLGLNRPLLQQFGHYSWRALHGDLGVSYVQRQRVTTLIAARIGPTLLLTGTALVASTLVGLSLAVVSTRRPTGPLATGVSQAALVAYSLPNFWLAQLAVLFLALRLHLFPAVGFNDAAAGHTGLAAAFDTGRHLVLPALVLSLSEVALLLRITQRALMGEAPKEYAVVARAKGLDDHQVLTHHVLPNSLLPVITVIGSRIGYLLSGAVLIESVFAWPGLGQLLTAAAQAGDQPVILGLVLLTSSAVVTANLLTDLIYARVDPRIQRR